MAAPARFEFAKKSGNLTLLCHEDDGGEKVEEKDLVRVDSEEGGGSYLCRVLSRSRSFATTDRHKPKISPRSQFPDKNYGDIHKLYCIGV